MAERKRKIRVLHLTCVRQLSAGQRRQISYEVLAAPSIEDGIWVSQALHAGRAVEAFEDRIPLLFRPIFLRNLFCWIYLLRHQAKYDYVLVRHMAFDPFALFFSWMVRNRISVHHSKEMHELPLISPGINGRMAAWLESLTGWIAVRNAAAVLGVTKEIAEYEQAARGLIKRAHVYPNGIDVEIVKPVLDRRDADHVNMVFICGKFSPWHGLDLLQAAIHEYCSTNVLGAVTIHLIGSLAEMDLRHIETCDYCRGVFVVHGRVDAEFYRSILDRCDIGIASLAMFRENLTEGATLKVRELLASGIPVFSGHRDTVVPESKDIFIVRYPPYDFKDMIDVAISAKNISREEVRDRSVDFISKFGAMSNVLRWIASWG